MSAIVRSFAEPLPVMTIPINLAVTNTQFIGDYAWGSIALPAAFTGTTLTFLVSTDGINFNPVCDDTNTPLTALTVSTTNQIPIPDNVFKFPYMQIQSGSDEAAARDIVLFMKG